LLALKLACTFDEHVETFIADTREQFKHRLKNWLFECAWREARLIDFLKVRHVNGLTYLLTSC